MEFWTVSINWCRRDVVAYQVDETEKLVDTKVILLRFFPDL